MNAAATIEIADLSDLDLFAGGFPYGLFAELRARRPVWWHPATDHTPGGEGYWCVLDHMHCAAAARDTATFSSHTGGGREGGGTLIEDLPEGISGTLLNMSDDPGHQRLRTLLTPALSPRGVARLEADLRSRAKRIVSGAMEIQSEAGEVDLLVDIAAELPLQAAASLMGVPQDDRRLLLEWADAQLDHTTGGSAVMTRAADLGAALHEYAGQLIDRRRQAPGDDLISLAARATDPDGSASITDDEIAMLFMLLAAAGTETTRNAIAVGLCELAQRPQDWSALGDDPALRPVAVEEMLRWSSPTPHNRRTATRHASFGDADIAPGDKVVLWWASANRDPIQFDHPDRFDIRRDPNPHLAFGHGSHFCLGARLARLEIRAVLDEMLDAVTCIESTAPIEWTRSNKHTGVRHAPARLSARTVLI